MGARREVVRNALHAIGVVRGKPPRHGAAPIVTNHGRTLPPQGIDQAEDILRQRGDAV